MRHHNDILFLCCFAVKISVSLFYLICFILNCLLVKSFVIFYSAFDSIAFVLYCLHYSALCLASVRELRDSVESRASVFLSVSVALFFPFSYTSFRGFFLFMASGWRASSPNCFLWAACAFLEYYLSARLTLDSC